jgi:hypothetical protein
MSDQPENNQILNQQPETITSVDAVSEPAETPIEIASPETILTTYSESTETPMEIATGEHSSTKYDEPRIENSPETPIEAAVRESISIANLETETEIVPIVPQISPETIYDQNYPTQILPETIDRENHPTQLHQTVTPEPKKTRIWQILAIFLSGMLVGSVLSLGTLLAWRMYQERVNLQIKLPADVPLPESPSPVPAAPANRLPAIPPAPGTAQPLTNTPSPNPIQIPPLSGIPQLASPSPLPSSSPSPTLETPVTERVSFEAGATGTTLSNTLPDNKSKRYLLGCNSGQSMTVNVQEGQVSAAIIAPNGEKVGTANSTSPWQGQLSSSGDYTIEISGDNKANYGVKIEVK